MSTTKANQSHTPVSSNSVAQDPTESLHNHERKIVPTTSRPARSQSVASVEVWRCLRCACAVEATSTDDLGHIGMVRIGFNLYYCWRCATSVGYVSQS